MQIQIMSLEYFQKKKKLLLDRIHLRPQIICLHLLAFVENYILSVLPDRNVQTNTKLEKKVVLNHTIIICFKVLPLHEIQTGFWMSHILLEELGRLWQLSTTKNICNQCQNNYLRCLAAHVTGVDNFSLYAFFVFLILLLHKIIS